MTAPRRERGRRPFGVRLFVAAYPPPGWADATVRALANAGLPSYRATNAAQVHLTVHFIGPVAKRGLDDAVESLSRSCAGLASFLLTPRAVVAFPGPERARLVAVETDAPPALLELRSRLVVRWARGTRSEPNDRFRPHLTLLRFRTPSAGPVTVPGVPLPEPFRVETIRLVRSVLAPAGARHDVVSEADLD